MSNELPRLRLGLEFFPSQDPEQPGLLIRDPYRFSEAVLMIPEPLVEALACFDGEQTELDLRASLVHATGEIQVGELERHLMTTLSDAGFLDDEKFDAMRNGRLREFHDAPAREAAHAGNAYPAEASTATTELDRYLQDGAGRSREGLIGIAAPHVSPFGGWRSYREAYAGLGPEYKDRTFVILGTSHYGAPDKFGLTRKPFVTPLGQTRTNLALIDELEANAGAGVSMEDYCHSIEHSIEFQVLFLQHLFGPDIRIVPILCGAYAMSLYRGGMPEDAEPVKRFLGALGDIAAREAHRLFWVLGIDMSHMGRRYGDPLDAHAGEGEMTNVERRDRARIDAVTNGDARGFWEQVRENHDPLKWCGSSPLYTFLKALPSARGGLERYEQWNIDDRSVVSFAALSFR